MPHWSLPKPNAPLPESTLGWGDTAFWYPQRINGTGGSFPVADRHDWAKFLKDFPIEMRKEATQQQTLDFRARTRVKLHAYGFALLKWKLKFWEKRSLHEYLLLARDKVERAQLPWTAQRNATGELNGLPDEEFAYQRLNGVNPHVIERVPVKMVASLSKRIAFPRCYNSPAGSPAAAAAAVAGVTGEVGATLETLAEAGRLFLCDYSAMLKCVDGDHKAANSVPPAGFCATAPIVLLYLAQPVEGKAAKLLPLVIQLQPVVPQDVRPAPAEIPALLPERGADGKDTPQWLAAKLHVQGADASVHEGVIHLSSCHLASEAMYLALLRSVGEQHPLRGFLRPHMWYTTQVNIAAREELVCRQVCSDRWESRALRTIGMLVPHMAEGLTVQLCPLSYDSLVDILVQVNAHYDFATYDVPRDLRTRGIHPEQDAAASIAGSAFWRDDALVMWAAIDGYVAKFVETFYTDDAAVDADQELQRWVATLRGEIGQQKGCGFVNVPGTAGKVGAEISTREELRLLLTSVVFNASPGHAAINNSLFEYCMDTAAMPRTFRLDPVKVARGEVDMKAVNAALPPALDCVTATALADTLSWTPEYGLCNPIGKFEETDEFFGKGNQGEAIAETLVAGLSKAAAAIDARNDEVQKDPQYASRRPYMFLHPKQLSFATSV